MNLLDQLTIRLGQETVVVGIGNPSRGDDAVGCQIARQLREFKPCQELPGLRTVEAEDVPESFLGQMVRPRPDTVILVDAVELGDEPGSVAILELEELEVRETSTHRAPLSLLARFVRAETGADIFLLGIQPGSRAVGAAVSPEVQGTARMMAEILLRAYRQATSGTVETWDLPRRFPEAPC